MQTRSTSLIVASSFVNDFPAFNISAVPLYLAQVLRLLLCRFLGLVSLEQKETRPDFGTAPRVRRRDSYRPCPRYSPSLERRVCPPLRVDVALLGPPDGSRQTYNN